MCLLVNYLLLNLKLWCPDWFLLIWLIIISLTLFFNWNREIHLHWRWYRCYLSSVTFMRLFGMIFCHIICFICKVKIWSITLYEIFFWKLLYTIHINIWLLCEIMSYYPCVSFLHAFKLRVSNWVGGIKGDIIWCTDELGFHAVIHKINFWIKLLFGSSC